MRKLKIVVTLLILLFWPVSLFLANTPKDFLRFAAPAVLIFLASKYYPCSRWYFLPILFIPAIEPKLALFPISFALIDGLFNKVGKQAIVYIVLGIIIFLFSLSGFAGQTIFKFDYEAQQLVIRSQQLYPNPLTARIFHNKGRIVWDKANRNFFEIIDLNNYFFGFAPRQVIERGQNLNKYPFLALPFLLLGFHKIITIGPRQHQKLTNLKKKGVQFVFVVLLASLVSLLPLSLYDRNDFILYVPLTLVILHGLQRFDNQYKSRAGIYYLVFLAFAGIEFTRIIIQFTK